MWSALCGSFGGKFLFPANNEKRKTVPFAEFERIVFAAPVHMCVCVCVCVCVRVCVCVFIGILLLWLRIVQECGFLFIVVTTPPSRFSGPSSEKGEVLRVVALLRVETNIVLCRCCRL